MELYDDSCQAITLEEGFRFRTDRKIFKQNAWHVGGRVQFPDRVIPKSLKMELDAPYLALIVIARAKTGWPVVILL